MKTRRSKRLSKSPVVIDSDSGDSFLNEKKQRLTKVAEKLQETQNDIKSGKLASDSCEKRNGDNHSSLDSKGNDSDSDSSTDFMKSPNTIDLDSEFFKVDFRKAGPSSDFSSIEKKIFSDVQQLSDSNGSSSDEDTTQIPYYEIPIPQLMQKNEEVTTPEENSVAETKSKKHKSVVKKKGNNISLKKSTAIKKECENIDEMDVSQLLAMGESKKNKDLKLSNHICISEDEMSDWEEVKVETTKEVKQENHSFPKEGVQITLDAPDIYHKRKKKDFDMAAFVKRRVNRIKREQQILVHKVHLLCWIGHGMFVNSVLNSEVLMGLSLSLIPSQHSYPKKVDIIYLKKLVGWFIKTIPVVEKSEEKKPFIHLTESLQQQFECGTACSNRDLVLMFVCLLRSLGLTARLIISLQPVRLRPESNELCDTKENKNKGIKAKEEEKRIKVKNEERKESEVKKSIKMKKDSQEKEKRNIKKELPVQFEKPKKKNSKRKKHRVLSPEDARKSNKQVMSKEEAIKLLNSRLEDTKMQSKAKKPRVTDVNITNKGSVEDEPRRSVRSKKSGNIKYKDASSSSSDNDESDDLKIVKQIGSSSNTSADHSKGHKKLSEKNLSIKDRKVSESMMSPKSIVNDKNVQNVKKSNGLSSNQDKCISLSKCSSEEHGVLDNKSSVMGKNSKQEERRTIRVHRRGRKPAGKIEVINSELEKSDCEDKTTVIKNDRSNNLKTDKHCPASQTNEEGDHISHSQSLLQQKKKYNCEKTVTKKGSSKKCGSDSDFEHELTSKIKMSKTNRKSGSDIDRRVLSTESDESGENEFKIKNDFWAEVLVDSDEWVPINVVTGEVNAIEKLRRLATKPITYVIAWNPDLTLKDVTCRYCKQFHSVTRKQRVDEKWWKESLFPFLSSNTARDKKEDEDMQKKMQDQPLPTSIAEYKNHPLYALKRHLLKFQAIYPPSAPTLGFVKGEPVYPRDCVYTLHSREIWLKEAKVVRLGEQPYKIVKARPKWDRVSGKAITDLPLEIFGIWQVEDYVPPTAKDGKVPRNAYGNVELFKPTMLPKGTVHLQVPCLNRVAKKLQIDCAPAVVGFDYHCGACHPMYDGFVVCEEFQDVLLDAWNRDQEEAEKREIEKREKRVYGNWRRLIKGLFIRERLKIKYAFGEEEEKQEKITIKGKKGKKNKPAPKKTESEDDDSD